MTGPVAPTNDAAIVLIDREIERISQIVRQCASQVQLHENKVLEWDEKVQEHQARVDQLRRAKEFL